MENVQAVTSAAPAPVTPPNDPAFLIQKLLGLHGYAVAGMYRAALAFLKNYDSVQGNSMAMMKASQAIEQEQLDAGNLLTTWLSDCQNGVLQAVQTYNDWIKNNPNADQDQVQDAQDRLNASITYYQGQSSIYNTQYGSTNQFWTGVDNGINQTSSDETQTESLDMQMFQQGVLTLAQQLAQAM